MQIQRNYRNAGRTIWGVLGHEAHVEQVDGRFQVCTRRANSLRRTVNVFTTYEDAVAHLATWTATETKGN